VIIYTNFLIPTGFAAITLWPFILIRPEYKGNEGLKAHEEVHWQQAWTSLFLFYPLYLFSKSYRLKVEVAAYREQLTYGGDPKLLASFLTNRYGLNINYDEALLLLTDHA
jgi:hypothetical protein